MIGIRAGIETALLGFIQDFGRESEHYIVKGEAKLISIIIVYTKICCVYLYLPENENPAIKAKIPDHPI
jgi:hypothetical protein